MPIREKIATIQIVLKGPLASAAVVHLDGKPLQPKQLGRPLAVSTGSHQLEASARTAQSIKRVVKAEVGSPIEQVIFELIPIKKKLAPPPPPPPATATDAEPSRVGPIILFSAAGALSVAGGVLGVLSLNDSSRLLETPGCPDKCPKNIQDEVDATKTDAHISTALFALAGASLVTGGAWWLLSGPSKSEGEAPPVSLRIGPGSIGVQGRF